MELVRRGPVHRPPIEKRRPRVIPPPPTYKAQEKSAHFILVKLAPSTLKQSIKEIENIDGISGFHPVYGEYDLVLIIRERNNFNKKPLLRSIWSVTGVLDVQTLLAAS
jgi:hypothetical protein